MSGVVIALDPARGSELAAQLERLEVPVRAVLEPGAITAEQLRGAAALIVPASRAALTAHLVAACDRAGVRIVSLGPAESRVIARFGLPEPLAPGSSAAQVAAAVRADHPATVAPPPPRPDRVIAIWGPPGSPGRSTIAIQLAVERARAGDTCALIDADTTAPALALLLGLDEESPGIAAACRRAELGGLDAAELRRLAITVETSGGPVEVLGGLNRPGRWPELSRRRLQHTLTACRDWVHTCVVDVASSFEADEELSDDVVGPRRHAATTTVLEAADAIVAVTAADPLSLSRFVREHAELRRLVGATPIHVVVNRLRPGPLGIDGRGQVRRTLDRFAGIGELTFAPFDQRACDAAMLHARPIADVTPRSPLVAAVRQVSAALTVGAALTAGAARGTAPTAGTTRGSSRGVRWRRRARAVPAGSPHGDGPASAS